MLFSFTLSPSKKTSPEVGVYRRSRDLPTVVLPQPDSPTRPRVSPGLMEKETPSTAFKGVVFINPVLIGKYCFKSRTSTRYSLLFFTSSLTVCLLFLPPWLPLRSASRMRNDRQAFAFPAAALRYRSSSLPRSVGKMHSPLAYLRG